MKQAKQRVLAIDYFRGVCLLIIILSHSFSFTRPFAYASGVGRLWVSAAEFFFLLSGITFGIVRGEKILTDFKSVLYKTWKRAGVLYLLYLATVAGSTLIYGLLPPTVSVLGSNSLPQSSGIPLLWQMLTFHYSLGLANFLIFFAVFLLFAPFILYAMQKYKAAWLAALTASIALFVSATTYPFHIIAPNTYTYFMIWQLYFIVGLILSKYRVTLISWYYNLSSRVKRTAYRAVTLAAGLTLATSFILGFSFGSRLQSLTAAGWLPQKLEAPYFHLTQYSQSLGSLLINNRMGILRPLAALLFLAAAYLIYQKHKSALLNYSGKFFITMGQNSLWVFVGQAFLIPLLISIPGAGANALVNFCLTVSLMVILWLLAQHSLVLVYLRNFGAEFKTAFIETRNAYLESFEDTV